MERSARIKRNARRWRLAGLSAFFIGAFLLYQKVYYETRDFYGNHFEVLSPESLNQLDSNPEHQALYFSAMEKMQTEEYWAAIDDLQELKESGNSSVALAEWNKILCYVALDRKDDAQELLEYYVGQPGFSYKAAEAKKLLKEY